MTRAIEETERYLVHHYADEEAREENARTIISWAIDEGAPVDITIEDAIVLLHDLGDVSVTPAGLV